MTPDTISLFAYLCPVAIVGSFVLKSAWPLIVLSSAAGLTIVGALSGWWLP